ncbi:MAG: hypothetical protein Q7K98_05755 [Candidatus Omnitrophota bacterium]|nr:hypothetical protein [Candidatus Omnitrophota bacterium]
MATESKAPVQAEAKPKEEKQTNCLSCNKPIKKIRRYYRDGKYYCTKRCWSNFIKKAKTAQK